MPDDASILAETKGGLAQYARFLRSAVRGLWAGVFDRMQFANSMISAIQWGLRRAFHEGAAEMGIKPEELTAEERIALGTHIHEQMGYVMAFADDIEAGSKANKGKLRPLLKRTVTWANRYNEVKNHAKLLTGMNKKLKWVLHLLRVTVESCGDCLKLDGRIHRASVWAAYDIRPQSPRLECGGFKCGCGFEPTDEKGSSGRPPKLTGD